MGDSKDNIDNNMDPKAGGPKTAPGNDEHGIFSFNTVALGTLPIALSTGGAPVGTSNADFFITPALINGYNTRVYARLVALMQTYKKFRVARVKYTFRPRYTEILNPNNSTTNTEWVGGDAWHILQAYDSQTVPYDGTQNEIEYVWSQANTRVHSVHSSWEYDFIPFVNTIREESRRPATEANLNIETSESGQWYNTKVLSGGTPPYVPVLNVNQQWGYFTIWTYAPFNTLTSGTTTPVGLFSIEIFWQFRQKDARPIVTATAETDLAQSVYNKKIHEIMNKGKSNIEHFIIKKAMWVRSNEDQEMEEVDVDQELFEPLEKRSADNQRTVHLKLQEQNHPERLTEVEKKRLHTLAKAREVLRQKKLQNKQENLNVVHPGAKSPSREG